MSSETKAQIAHIFRRCGFGPAPGQVEVWEERGPQALLDALLDNENRAWRDEATLFDGFPLAGTDDDQYQLSEQLMLSQLHAMRDGSNPLHERMAWYWHTHFTSSLDDADGMQMWRQHHLLRQHALGNFTELVRAITTDAAMLLYLNGSDSRGENPNENYARELLELFTLGRDGGYTEDDVRAAARILSGWWVDWETGEVFYEVDNAYTRPVTFMGERRRWSLDDFIEFVCSRRACAAHVASRLYHHLVGPDLSDARRDELGAAFRDSGNDIGALVTAILRGEDFMEARRARARQPVEWLLAAQQAMGVAMSPIDHDDKPEIWWLESLGQLPWHPPNVGGWPHGDQWASASQTIARTAILLGNELPELTYDVVEPTVDAVLARCGVYDPSESTLAALKQIEAEVSEYDGRLELLFTTVLISPEFALL